MEGLKEYIASGGRSQLPPKESLEGVVAQYPWFGMARLLRGRLMGEIDSLSALSLCARSVPMFFREEYRSDDVMRRTDREIIESFLSSGEHRIVPTDATPEYLENVPYVDTPSAQTKVVVDPPKVEAKVDAVSMPQISQSEEPQVEEERPKPTKSTAVPKGPNELIIKFLPDEDDEFITEDLAEIYLNQELYDQAKVIYSRLCLLNPEKSVYFAEIIDRIERLKESEATE